MPCSQTSLRIWPTFMLTWAQARQWSVGCESHLFHIRPHIGNHTLISSWHVGKEIWEQTHGRVSAFVCGAGTGGTIAGVSTYLKSQKPAVKVFLADPPGSSLHNKVNPTLLSALHQVTA